MAVLGGGSGQSILEEHLFIESCTFSPWANCTALVTVVGGGGSGGTGQYIGGYSNGAATGGGAGGCGKSLLSLSKDVTYTITAGAGGPVTTPQNLTAKPGQTGGNSSFGESGQAALITANGGGAGAGVNGAAHQSVSASGASGGTSSGGNLFNTTGGGSGSVAVTFAAPSGHYSNNYVTGGGAVGLYGEDGFASGSIANGGAGAVYTSRYYGTGGGGLGAAGGDLDPSSQVNKFSYGGPGLRGAKPTGTTSGNRLPGSYLMGLPQGVVNSLDSPFTASGPLAMGSLLSGNFTAFQMEGVGVGGNGSRTNTYYPFGGLFAGGGGGIGNSSNSVSGGNGYLGSGGGAFGAYNASNSTATVRIPGAGGDGFIVIQILNWSI